MRKPRFRLYHLILLIAVLSIMVLLVARFASPHMHADIYHPQNVDAPEELWDPLYSSMKFGLQYLLIALIAVGTMVSALLFFVFRDDGSSSISS